MNEQQINVAIAEVTNSPYTRIPIYVITEPNETTIFSHYEMKPPDYCNDLNAMHEAECVMLSWHEVDAQAFSGYIDYLRAAVSIYTEHATARQRAEAFLRTLNLWQDDVVICKNCEGTGIISYNPCLNPNVFLGSASGKCTRCNGTGNEASQSESGLIDE